MAWIQSRFELAATAHTRLLPMEGLRGIAVTLVFMVHFATLVEPWVAGSASAGLLHGLHRIGNTGVDLFFALSGFLIYGALIRRPRPFVPFMARRIQRLYPTFLAVLTVYLALSLLFPQESKFPREPVEAGIYLVQNLLMLPGIFDIQPIITVAWSLSYEMFFYLAVPAVVAGLGLRSWDWRARLALFLAAVALWQGLHLPHGRMCMFAAGMIVVEILPQVRHRPGAAWLDAGALVAAPAALALVWVTGLNAAALIVLCAALVLVCLAAFSQLGPLHKLLSWAPLRWLGNMSYSYYLFHGLALKAVFLVFGRLHAPTGDEGGLAMLVLPPAFAATLAASAALYLAIERPYSILPAEKSETAKPLAVAAGQEECG